MNRFFYNYLLKFVRFCAEQEILLRPKPKEWTYLYEYIHHKLINNINDMHQPTVLEYCTSHLYSTHHTLHLLQELTTSSHQASLKKQSHSCLVAIQFKCHLAQSNHLIWTTPTPIPQLTLDEVFNALNNATAKLFMHDQQIFGIMQDFLLIVYEQMLAIKEENSRNVCHNGCCGNQFTSHHSDNALIIQHFETLQASSLAHHQSTFPQLEEWRCLYHKWGKHAYSQTLLLHINKTSQNSTRWGPLHHGSSFLSFSSETCANCLPCPSTKLVTSEDCGISCHEHFTRPCQSSISQLWWDKTLMCNSWVTCGWPSLLKKPFIWCILRTIFCVLGKKSPCIYWHFHHDNMFS